MNWRRFYILPSAILFLCALSLLRFSMKLDVEKELGFILFLSIPLSFALYFALEFGKLAVGDILGLDDRD